MLVPAADQLTLADFDFALPEALIAQEPARERDRSRLMVLDRQSGSIEHRIFQDLENYLLPGDLLVLNNTRVFPCRLPAKKPGGGKAEIFLLAELGLNLWDALVKGGVPAGKRLILDAGVEAEIVSSGDDGTKRVRFHGVPDIRNILTEVGRTPLPPYIKREPTVADLERYQTVYAAQVGAVAAPTAGLHFTCELLDRLRANGVGSAMVTLHVGPGTFQPVRVEKIAEHRMLPERYEIAPDAAEAINRAKSGGRRIIAVGTTSMRTLETAAQEDGMVASGEGSSRLFIYPGFVFRIVDGLITNFHLPKSTLLMLVSAFAGRERVLAAYQLAVEHQYRFYSYGDAMFIRPGNVR
jgi:S-adenosylmethionine:tRNA ribosyltransferase-isomerase